MWGGGGRGRYLSNPPHLTSLEGPRVRVSSCSRVQKSKILCLHDSGRQDQAGVVLEREGFLGGGGLKGALMGVDGVGGTGFRARAWGA